MKLQRLYVEYTLTNALYDLRRRPSKKRGVVAQPFKYIIVAMCEVVKDKDFETEAFSSFVGGNSDSRRFCRGELERIAC